ncbi:unnamed protein product [Laminaria digitata]
MGVYTFTEDSWFCGDHLPRMSGVRGASYRCPGCILEVSEALATLYGRGSKRGNVCSAEMCFNVLNVPHRENKRSGRRPKSALAARRFGSLAGKFSHAAGRSDANRRIAQRTGYLTK